MDKLILENLVNQYYSQHQMAKILNVSQSTIRWWLKKYDLQTKLGQRGKHPHDYPKIYKCTCGETNPEKFYGRKNYICSSCHNSYNIKQGQARRLKALEYLGLKCIICSYSKYTCSLDIHHLDPSLKDPNFASMRSWSWERIEKEIQNCILLCKNCHAAVHAGLTKIPG